MERPITTCPAAGVDAPPLPPPSGFWEQAWSAQAPSASASAATLSHHVETSLENGRETSLPASARQQLRRSFVSARTGRR